MKMKTGYAGKGLLVVGAMLVFGLGLLSQEGHAVIFSVVDVTNTPPYDQVGETFTLEVRINASDLPATGDGSKINGYAICLGYDSNKVEPVLQTVTLQDGTITNTAPFAKGTFLNSALNPLQDEVLAPGKIFYAISDLAFGGTATDVGVLASVTFRVTQATGAVSFAFCGLDNPAAVDATTFSLQGVGGAITPNVVDLNDVSLPVELSAFNADRTSDGVLIRWRTESETNNLGFDVYRIEGEKTVKVNVQIIKGHGTTGEPHDYQFLDTNPPDNASLKYFLEDIDVTGKRNRSRIISVGGHKGKRITPWGRIKAQR
ncbi:hypothetical protein HYR99_26990 [Candidatus Poribacteria bacterium]|nr:hypothetical protein [Candidatus Poribacteria bacterium]